MADTDVLLYEQNGTDPPPRRDRHYNISWKQKKRYTSTRCVWVPRFQPAGRSISLEKRLTQVRSTINFITTCRIKSRISWRLVSARVFGGDV
jgi:hypothetical protein